MFQIFQYYGRYQGLRGRLAGMPAWARAIVFVFALPGIIGVALSLLALGVSILALLLLTSPVYRLLSWLTGSGAADPAQSVDFAEPQVRRHVDVKIIE